MAEEIKEEIKTEAIDEQKEEERILKEAKAKKRFFESIGRRKTSSARVRLFTQGKKGVEVNGKLLGEYFAFNLHQQVVLSPLEKLKCEEKFGFTVIVRGGGKSSQAQAIRHGIARALVLLNPYFKKRLKKFGYLTRDPRMVERKKPGLNKARRAPQWSKR